MMSDIARGHNSKNEPVLVFDNISKKFCRGLKRSLFYGMQDIAGELLPYQNSRRKSSLRREEFWALKDISFTLNRGESLAIVGSNGAGKSTILKLLYGLIKPDVGNVQAFGTIGAIIELGAGFDQTLSGRENIYIRTALFGLSRKETRELIDKIVDFAEIGEFIDSPVKYYSSGMLARLSFAISTHLKPTVLLVDEVLAVGDLSFQRKCLNQMLNYINDGGSLILVSHNPNLIQSTCKRGILVEKGRVAFEGTAIETVDKHFESEFSGDNVNSSVSEGKSPTQDVPVVIEEITLQSLENAEINTGDDVKLIVDYSSYKSFKEVGWMFTIWNRENIICITGDACIDPISIKEGTAQLSCTIRGLPLLAGKYLIKMTIVELATLHPLVTYGWIELGHVFEVKTQPTAVTNAMRSDNQLVTIDTVWN